MKSIVICIHCLLAKYTEYFCHFAVGRFFSSVYRPSRVRCFFSLAGGLRFSVSDVVVFDSIF